MIAQCSFKPTGDGRWQYQCTYIRNNLRDNFHHITGGGILTIISCDHPAVYSSETIYLGGRNRYLDRRASCISSSTAKKLLLNLRKSSLISVESMATRLSRNSAHIVTIKESQ